MSNILYRVQMSQPAEQSACVIDSNLLLESCIASRKKKQKQYSDASLDSGNVFVPMDEEYASAELQSYSEEEALASEEPEIDYVATAQAEAEEILENAKAEAEEILAKARAEAEALCEDARRRGQQEGFLQGEKEAMEQRQQMEQELLSQKEIWQREYEEKSAVMERDLVDVICQVVEKVFLVQFGDKKELIVHAVEDVLTNTDGSKTFFVRVGEANLEFLRQHKEELQEKVGQDVVIDILLDPLLDETQCMIEADGGLFDCGMDTQMRNLIKDIKSLS